MTLPENIDASYLDQSPGDATHQQHHDEIHQKVNRIPAGTSPVVTEATGNAAYARWLGYAEVTTSQTGIGGTATTITGLSVAVTLTESTRLRITHFCGNVRGNTVGDVAEVKVLQDGAQIQSRMVPINNTVRNGGGATVGYEVLGAGSYTFTVSLVRASGTGTVDHIAGSSSPGLLLVEALGGS